MTTNPICPEPVLHLRRMKIRDDINYHLLELGIAGFLMTGASIGCATMEGVPLVIAACFLCMMTGWAIWAINDIRHAFRRLKQINLQD